MTPQEQQLIDGLIQRVNGTNLADKDPEAEGRLQQGLASNPNALYILSQTVIVQQYALDQAKQQLDALKSQLAQGNQQQPPQKHTGFLESIFGSHSDSSDSRPAAPPSQQGYAPVPNQGQPTYSPPPTYAPPANYAPAQTMGGGGGGGFLRSAAQTAAGVAAGALAFQGVESLLHGFGNNIIGGGSGLGGFGMGNEAPREEVINNYYGGDGNDRDTGDRDSRGFDNDNNPGDNMFTDSSDSDDSSNFADDSGSDDSSSFDDSGSDDGGDLGNDNSF